MINVSDQSARTPGTRRAPIVPGSEAALTRLRGEISRLEVELERVEGRAAEVERSGLTPPAVPAGSARMADDLAVLTVEQERADMARFLEGTSMICAARVVEAQNEARARLSTAREDLVRAVEERKVVAESAIASPPRPLDDEGALDPVLAAALVVSDEAPMSVETAPVVGASVPTASHRRESVISLLLWIVGGALVVVGVAFAIVVILMLLD